MFCLFLRFSKDLLILACVLSEVAQRCTVFAHFGNMSSFFASVLSTITKLVFYEFMRVIFGIAKKLSTCKFGHKCTLAHLQKNALCARATFVFTSGRGLTFTSAHVMVRAPTDGQRLATHRHRAPHSVGAQRGCRGGAEESAEESAEAGAHGVAWGVCVCVCVYVGGEVTRGEGEGEDELRTGLQVPELSCRILFSHHLWRESELHRPHVRARKSTQLHVAHFPRAQSPTPRTAEKQRGGQRPHRRHEKMKWTRTSCR